MDANIRQSSRDAGGAPVSGVSRASLAIAAFSTVVEWYDFTLYLYMVTTLARIFFGDATPATALGGFAAAYLLRPLGAAVFGHIGDAWGRRKMMLLSMGLMAAAMLATALLPTRGQIGPAAGGLLLLMRAIMAFSVGGEYTGVIAYLLEGAPAGRRGLYASCAAAASEIGGLLAAAICALTVAAMSGADFESWGWRLPFFFGAVLAGAVGLARATLEESPEFSRLRSAGGTEASPLRRAASLHRPEILRGFAISSLGSITYYVGVTYVPAFLVAARAMPEADAFSLSALAALAVVLVTPFVGALSDAFGRKPVLLLLAASGVLLPVAGFAAMAEGGPALALTGALALAALGGGVSAVGAVASAELLPVEARLSGLALGMTLATAFFGGFTPYLAQILVERTGWTPVPGALIAGVALCVLPALARMSETRPARGPR